MDFNIANYMLAGVKENAMNNGGVHSPSKVSSQVEHFILFITVPVTLITFYSSLSSMSLFVRLSCSGDSAIQDVVQKPLTFCTRIG